MGCTMEMLRMSGVTHHSISVFFRECGYPLAAHLVRRRVEDQRWLYVHAELLKRLDMWEDPEFISVPQNAARMFNKHKYGGKLLGEIGEVNPDVLGTVIRVKLPTDEED